MRATRKFVLFVGVAAGMLGLLAVGATAAVLDVSEPPDVSGQTFTVDVGVNTVGGSLATPSDSSDSFTIDVPGTMQVTHVRFQYTDLDAALNANADSGSVSLSSGGSTRFGNQASPAGAGQVTVDVTDGAFDDPPTLPITGDFTVNIAGDFVSPAAPWTLTLTVEYKPCGSGSYSNSGLEPCLPAPAGSFAAGTGNTAATPCAPGSYQPDAGQSSCIPAPPGSFTAGPGSTAATPCAPGTYQPNAGATSCLLAPVDTFVASSGATAPTPCPSGTTQPLQGQTSCISADNEAPVHPAAPADLVLQCANQLPLPVTLTAVDNVDGLITVAPSAVVTPGSSVNDFRIVRTWTFTDNAGNSSFVSQVITVLDTVAPAPPAAPADLFLQGADDVPLPVNLTAVDNCDGPITVAPSAQVTPGDSANDFTMIRFWTFTDVTGNSSFVSQVITVLDDEAPVPPAAPADLVLQCANQLPLPVTLTAVDNVDGPITVSPSQQLIFGSSPNDFRIVRTWTFSDVTGNSSSVSQVITVLDTVAPAPPAAPADLFLQSADDVPPPVDLTAVDNCDGPITVSPSQQLIFGSSPNDFTLVRTWTFTDVTGNSSTVSQVITVFDNVPPTVTVPAGITIGTDPGVSTAVATFVVTASDNAPGPVTLACTPDSGSTFSVGTTEVTCTATDSTGNSGSASFVVTVIDDERPTWSVPADITDVLATGLDGAAVSYEALASDNVGVTSSSCSPVPGATFGLGETTVTCTASDAAGNTATASFTVTVVVDGSSIGTLDDEIAALGLPNGVTRSLQGPLNQAQKVLDDANPDNDEAVCDKLDSFLEHVQDRLSDGNLTPSLAASLTAFGEAIKVSLGCP